MLGLLLLLMAVVSGQDIGGYCECKSCLEIKDETYYYAEDQGDRCGQGCLMVTDQGDDEICVCHAPINVTGGETAFVRSCTSPIEDNKDSDIGASGECGPMTVECSLPSLGRQITLGSGWDVRSGMAITSRSPWTTATITSKKVKQTNHFKSVLLEWEKNSSERARRLDIKSNLEVNVLSGVVKVGAGAKYMKKNKLSSNSVRLVLDYSTKNFFNRLPISSNPVENIEFCNTGNGNGGPTHVVTSVQYGTKAFVLFEREVSGSEDENEIAAWMNLAVKESTVGVDASGNFNSTNINNHEKSSINVYFLGNTLINSPTTVDDINTLITNLDASSNDNPQPVSFTITKIDQICSSANVVFSSIGGTILDRLAAILRSFADNQLRTNTLLINPNSIAQRHVIKQALVGTGSFGNALAAFETDIKMKLSSLLVTARSNGSDAPLLEVIFQVALSDFEQDKASTFLDYIEREVNSFDAYYGVLNVEVDDAVGSRQIECRTGGAKDTYIFIMNVLPVSNLATDFFAGTLNTNNRWIHDNVGPKFRLFRDAARVAKIGTSCFVVDLAAFDPIHPVTFKVFGMLGERKEDHEQLPTIPERQVTLDNNRCHWVNSNQFGQVSACSSDEFAAGACAGGGGFGNKDCKGGRTVHSLYCCQVSTFISATVDEDNCASISSGFGGQATCAQGHTVHKSCSSGSGRDCPLEGGSMVVNRIDCCPVSYNGLTVEPRGDGDCDNWIYGGFGWDLTCPKDYVLTGRCGSGRNKDCPNGTSHGIKCCKMFIVR